MKPLRLILCLFLAGCAGVHVDAGDAEPCVLLDDGGAPPALVGVSGRVACGTLSVRAAAYEEDCALPCPWDLPSRPSDPDVICDVAAWEACFDAAWIANTCTSLEAALEDCDPTACR